MSELDSPRTCDGHTPSIFVSFKRDDFFAIHGIGNGHSCSLASSGPGTPDLPSLSDSWFDIFVCSDLDRAYGTWLSVVTIAIFVFHCYRGERSNRIQSSYRVARESRRTLTQSLA